ncbi:hypothetical protein [Kitasatospora sp. NPDC097643]|uniref:hypothetical protein n=1 Tax=Kitasatospora sp. NPDC097643 TaxID=3157230 RepID=UPI00332581A0
MAPDPTETWWPSTPPKNELRAQPLVPFVTDFFTSVLQHHGLEELLLKLADKRLPLEVNEAIQGVL